ncbi:hypothetical protein ASPSYDRAFT_1160870 [Aspergillus sydowii CBS 593.65]|uniref:Deoxyribonuclease NucA/NucB domain-containing protein n=1 Tax=Aspergillus sydowii CBS 593.65 TaxID=1036612 RepID=A0A1L9T4R2_9EURO|nr:uncharacterized protein ASPSYDRAFT_1160870 [Aspergillus sydowii CBS 593.65]OJJ54424.1 hypothetical protein ASPSYDRAFT_1160870 [Aspergillus sydowii CBS 593.65]
MPPQHDRAGATWEHVGTHIGISTAVGHYHKQPKGSSGNVQMLELRISCAKLQDISEKHVTDGTSYSLFSNDKDRTEERYDNQCPDGTCVAANKILNDNVGRTGSRPKLALQCDEFPWKSSEQGGKYMDKLDPGRRTRTCVPGYQNNWHGQCFKLMGQMQFNWKRLELELELRQQGKSGPICAVNNFGQDDVYKYPKAKIAVTLR